MKRLADFLEDLDEAIHYDPVLALEQRVSRLETQIHDASKVHSDVPAGDGK
jgi:hypothetical protein